jgi:hypothetical protein
MPLGADDPVPGESTTTDPGDLDDDWPAFPVLDEEPTIRR